MANGYSKSRRGVYYNLNKSPYEFTTPYGDSFKFPSEKKLEIYKRDIDKEVERINKALKRLDIDKRIPNEIVNLIMKEVYRAFYYRVVG